MLLAMVESKEHKDTLRCIEAGLPSGRPISFDVEISSIRRLCLSADRFRDWAIEAPGAAKAGQPLCDSHEIKKMLKYETSLS